MSVSLLLHAVASPQTWTHANAQAAKRQGEGEEAALLAVHATAFPALHRPCNLRGLTGSLHACMRWGGGLSARRCHAVSKGYGEPAFVCAANFHHAAAPEELDKGHAPPLPLHWDIHTKVIAAAASLTLPLHPAALQPCAGSMPIATPSHHARERPAGLQADASAIDYAARALRADVSKQPQKARCVKSLKRRCAGAASEGAAAERNAEGKLQARGSKGVR